VPVYEYRGVTTGNRTTRGWIDAESARTARQKLRSDGIYLTDLTEGRTGSSVSDWLARLQLPQLRRVPDLELALFTRQLSTLISAGIPLVESLTALTDQVENQRLKNVTGRVRESVNHGTSFADALGDHPHVFGDLYRAMVRAGEASGALALVLSRLGDYVESQMELRNKVINAMIYPVIMIIASLAVTSALLIWVIPTITSLLRDLDQPLPFATVVVIGMSDFLIAWWPALVIGTVTLLLAMNRLTRTERGRLVWDRFRLALPVVGRSVRLIAISRFARTLSIAGGVTGNAVIRASVSGAQDSITRGSTIAGPLRQSGEFPSMVTHMISVGEASGELEGMLAKVADIYDELVDNSLNRLTTFMGPVLLLIVAGLVVLIIVSTLLPLLSLTAAL
jgi:general secretion pathway protein F